MPLILDAGNYYLDRFGRLVEFGYLGLLDGRGGRLLEGAEPVWVEWSRMSLDAGLSKNSAGQPFSTTAGRDT